MTRVEDEKDEKDGMDGMDEGTEMNAPSEIFSQRNMGQGNEAYSSDEHSLDLILVSLYLRYLCHYGTIPPVLRDAEWGGKGKSLPSRGPADPT
jgi:hypothetical protein